MGEKHEMTKNVIKACPPSKCMCVRVGMGTRVHSPKTHIAIINQKSLNNCHTHSHRRHSEDITTQCCLISNNKYVDVPPKRYNTSYI